MRVPKHRVVKKNVLPNNPSVSRRWFLRGALAAAGGAVVGGLGTLG